MDPRIAGHDGVVVVREAVGEAARVDDDPEGAHQERGPDRVGEQAQRAACPTGLLGRDRRTQFLSAHRLRVDPVPQGHAVHGGGIASADSGAPGLVATPGPEHPRDARLLDAFHGGAGREEAGGLHAEA